MLLMSSTARLRPAGFVGQPSPLFGGLAGRSRGAAPSREVGGTKAITKGVMKT